MQKKAPAVAPPPPAAAAAGGRPPPLSGSPPLLHRRPSLLCGRPPPLRGRPPPLCGSPPSLRGSSPPLRGRPPLLRSRPPKLCRRPQPVRSRPAAAAAQQAPSAAFGYGGGRDIRRGAKSNLFVPSRRFAASGVLLHDIEFRHFCGFWDRPRDDRFWENRRIIHYYCVKKGSPLMSSVRFGCPWWKSEWRSFTARDRFSNFCRTQKIVTFSISRYYT